MSGNSAMLMGILGRLAGTLGDVDAGACWLGALCVGSGNLGVVSLCGAICSKIADNSFIACIFSAPGCLNGVAGDGWRSGWVRLGGLQLLWLHPHSTGLGPYSTGE
jgi:hypothetical protein